MKIFYESQDNDEDRIQTSGDLWWGKGKKKMVKTSA